MDCMSEQAEHADQQTWKRSSGVLCDGNMTAKLERNEEDMGNSCEASVYAWCRGMAK